MQNSIILQNLTSEQLGELIDSRLKAQLESLKAHFGNGGESDTLMTREQAAAFLSIDLSTLWSWTNKGRVKCYAIGARRYYKRNELIETLKPL